MTEAGIGRVLVASLHQAIADILPDRLEFYENWLNPTGMRQGTIGLAPLYAVLSFLRREDGAYPLVVERAGRYAGEWTMLSQGSGRRTLLRFAPRPVRQRAALGAARVTIRRIFVGSRGIVSMRRGQGTVQIKGSPFCNLRELAAYPMCGFYAALVSRLLELHHVDARVETAGCRAAGDRACLLHVQVGP